MCCSPHSYKPTDTSVKPLLHFRYPLLSSQYAGQPDARNIITLVNISRFSDSLFNKLLVKGKKKNKFVVCDFRTILIFFLHSNIDRVLAPFLLLDTYSMSRVYPERITAHFCNLPVAIVGSPVLLPQKETRSVWSARSLNRLPNKNL